jgi:hypothetical protein
MIGNSTAEYVWVVTWAAILHSIGPISVVYCVLATIVPNFVPYSRHVLYWSFVETIFFILTYIYQSHHLQRPALHPLPASRRDRNELFDLCLDSTQDHKQYISKWFRNERLSAIKRDNVKEFFRWAFLNTDIVDPNYDDELETYVQRLEERTGAEFPQGRGEVKSLRLTLERVGALHRSLVWYMVRTSPTVNGKKLMED